MSCAHVPRDHMSKQRSASVRAPPPIAFSASAASRALACTAPLRLRRVPHAQKGAQKQPAPGEASGGARLPQRAPRQPRQPAPP